MNHFLQKHNIHLQPDEHVLLFTRKHWMKLLYDIAALIVAAIPPLLLLFALGNGNGSVSPVWVFFLSLILLSLWIGLFVAWTNHYLDVWIVTDKRIIHIEQISLFHRTKSTIRVERVQNVSIRRKGLLEEIFNFGTISVETAGYKTFMTQMHYIPNPAHVAQVIMRQVDRATERDAGAANANPTRTP